MESTEGVPGRRNAAKDDPLSRSAAMLEGLPDAVVAISRDERIVFVNALAEELFGYRRDELLGGPVQTLWPERVRARYTDNMRLYFATRASAAVLDRGVGAAPRRLGVRRRDDLGRGEHRRGAAAAGDRARRHRSVVPASSASARSRRSASGRWPAPTRRSSPADAVDAHPHDAAGRRRRGAARPTAPCSRHTGRSAEASLRLRLGARDEMLIAPERALGDDELAILRTIVNILTTAMGRLRDEDRMRHDALHDPLTGLANRTLLCDRLDHALAQSEREDGETGVLFVDLDNFKQVNDMHGHAVGDELLAALGGRLQTAVRPADTVARMGGDEFVVVCEHADETGTLALADRLETAIAVPVDRRRHRAQAVGEHRHRDRARRTPTRCIRDADAAVYRAKAAGGARIEMFSASA